MITSGALACFAVFMRSRAIAGIRVFEVTHKDKVEFQEMRRELGVRRILARLAGGFGSICFIGGVVTLLQNRADWHISLGMIAICGFLALCTSLLLKGFK